MREIKVMNKFALTVLGAGTMVPTKERNPAGFLVEVNDKKILIDVGHGVIRRMVDMNISFQDIDMVFISHFHTDHFGDAFSLVHTRWINDGYRGNAHKKLLFLGPNGLGKRFKLWRKIYWPEPNEFYPVQFKEGVNKTELGKIKIETFPVIHVRWFSSVGIIIKFAGKKLVYTGDIGSKHDFNDLVSKSEGADLLITEASYERLTPNHYTIGQIKDLANKAKIKKVLIVHISPQHVKRVRKVCQKEPKFILGKDGMELVI